MNYGLWWRRGDSLALSRWAHSRWTRRKSSDWRSTTTQGTHNGSLPAKCQVNPFFFFSINRSRDNFEPKCRTCGETARTVQRYSRIFVQASKNRIIENRTKTRAVKLPIWILYTSGHSQRKSCMITAQLEIDELHVGGKCGSLPAHPPRSVLSCMLSLFSAVHFTWHQLGQASPVSIN